MRKVKHIIKRDKNGNIEEFHLSATESNMDWLASGRLLLKIRTGDSNAIKNLKEIDKKLMEYQIENQDNDIVFEVAKKQTTIIKREGK